MNATLRCVKCNEPLFGDLTNCASCGKRQPASVQAGPASPPLDSAAAQSPQAAEASQPPGAAAAEKGGATAAPAPRPGGSKLLVGVVVAMLVLAGGGYWAWSQKQAADQRVAELEQKQAEEAQRRQEEQRARELKEAEERGRKEAEEKIKQELAQKEAEERAKAEAERERKVQEEKQQAAPSQARGAESVVEQASRCADMRQCLSVILAAADPLSPQAVRTVAARMRELSTVRPGDAASAKELNRRAVEEHRRNNQAASLDLLVRAAQADPSDAAVQGNLGLVLLRAGRIDEAGAALLRSLQLDPARTYTWQALSEYLVATSRREMAVRALLVNHELASAKDQVVPTYERLARSANADMRAVYELAVLKLKGR